MFMFHMELLNTVSSETMWHWSIYTVYRVHLSFLIATWFLFICSLKVYKCENIVQWMYKFAVWNFISSTKVCFFWFLCFVSFCFGTYRYLSWDKIAYYFLYAYTNRVVLFNPIKFEEWFYDIALFFFFFLGGREGLAMIIILWHSEQKCRIINCKKGFETQYIAYDQ